MDGQPFTAEMVPADLRRRGAEAFLAAVKLAEDAQRLWEARSTLCSEADAVAEGLEGVTAEPEWADQEGDDALNYAVSETIGIYAMSVMIDEAAGMLSSIGELSLDWSISDPATVWPAEAWPIDPARTGARLLDRCATPG